jgi:hypothetical protein
MKKLGVIRSLVATALIAAFGGVATAQVAEVEENSAISSSQRLTVDTSGTVTVTAFLGTGDVDFYSFEGTKNDKVTIDINGGMQNGLDLYVSFLGPNASGPQQALDGNDDCNYPADVDPCLPEPGSVPISLASDGVYYVAVTHIPAQVDNNGAVLSYVSSIPVAGADYTLTISGVTPAEVPQDPPPSEDPPAPQPPAVKDVHIDIRPGERAERATVHLSRARIPVAILSSADFDAMQIDTTTLTFGRSGDEQSLEKCYSKGFDVNRDRRRDMVCLFSVKAASFEPNDVVGLVKGSTTTGTQFQGRGLLKVVELYKSRRHRGHSHDWRDGRRHRDDDRWDHRGRRDRDDDDDDDRRKRR